MASMIDTRTSWTSAMWRRATSPVRPFGEHVSVTEQLITSPSTAHRAHRNTLGGADDWTVSFLPGRHLNKHRAVAAIRLAAAVADDPDAITPHIEVWASALGLTANDAKAMATDDIQHDDHGATAGG